MIYNLHFRIQYLLLLGHQYVVLCLFENIFVYLYVAHMRVLPVTHKMQGHIISLNDIT